MKHSRPTVSDVVVIGGGVIGLASAWRLAQGGARVTVLDAGYKGQASAAAAGMLAPLAEARAPGPLLSLGLDSLRRYPAWASALASASGLDIAPLGPGLLRVARTNMETEALQMAFAWQVSLGLPLTWLTGAEARAREPSLAPDIQAAILSPTEQHIPPRPLLTALRQACSRAGVAVRRGQRAVGLAAGGRRILTVQSQTQQHHGGWVLVTAGTWSAEWGGALRAPLPITPVRGQALTLGPLSPSPLSYTIYGTSGYLVPRPGGLILAGATEEDAGFDVKTTREGRTTLRGMASALVPELAGVPVAESWAGLRPICADGLPVLGVSPGWDNVVLAAGHGRNGILLAPETAELVAALILNGAPPPPAFCPERFGKQP